jgi:hypothetical protein
MLKNPPLTMRGPAAASGTVRRPWDPRESILDELGSHVALRAIGSTQMSGASEHQPTATLGLDNPTRSPAMTETPTTPDQQHRS